MWKGTTYIGRIFVFYCITCNTLSTAAHRVKFIFSWLCVCMHLSFPPHVYVCVYVRECMWKRAEPEKRIKRVDEDKLFLCEQFVSADKKRWFYLWWQSLELQSKSKKESKFQKGRRGRKRGLPCVKWRWDCSCFPSSPSLLSISLNNT